MSGKRCQRCKSYWRLHGSKGECVQEPGVEASISRWEAHVLDNALASMRMMIVDYLKREATRWSETDAAAQKGADRCAECDWPPEVGDLPTRYSCQKCLRVVWANL